MSDYPPSYGPPQEGDDDERFFCRFTFGQFFAILLLEVFTLFFVFYLGARYGRQFLGLEDNRIMVTRADSVLARVPTTEDPEVTAMARELIAQAKTPELKERIATMLGEGKRGESPPPPSPPPPAAPEATPPEASVGDEVVRVKSGEGARYSIQIGSYSDLTQANDAVGRWKERGYAAYMMIADIPDRGRWYRVRIGGFATRDDATVYLQEFADREHVDALVVLNEQ